MTWVKIVILPYAFKGEKRTNAVEGFSVVCIGAIRAYALFRRGGGFTILIDIPVAERNKRISPRSILNTTRYTIKWIAISLGMEPQFFSAHSVRAGGASTLFANATDLEIIRRFGRWEPSRFNLYLYGDNLNFRHLSLAFALGDNLLDEIKLTNDTRKLGQQMEVKPAGKRPPHFRHRVGGATSADDEAIVNHNTGRNARPIGAQRASGPFLSVACSRSSMAGSGSLTPSSSVGNLDTLMCDVARVSQSSCEKVRCRLARLLVHLRCLLYRAARVI